MINGILEGDVFYDRPGVAVVTWDPATLAVYIDWRSWADPAEFELLLEAGIRAWLTGSLAVVDGGLNTA